MSFYYDVFETPLGWMGALASGKGLRRTTLPQASPDRCVSLLGGEIERAAFSPERFGDLKGKLALYFQGAPVTFRDETIDVEEAPPFLRAAWKACRSIPRGKTHSYKWLADQAGSPQAARGRRPVHGEESVAHNHTVPQGNRQRRRPGGVRQGVGAAGAETEVAGHGGGYGFSRLQRSQLVLAG